MGLINSGFAQVLAYFARHRGRALHSSVEQSPRESAPTPVTGLGPNAYATGIDFPLQLHRLRREFGLDADYYEQINGSRRIENLDPPKVTFVDNMFEFMVRSMAEGFFINDCDG
ncbi:MAG: hypothetical protein WDN45_18975 [Caulobacteraceae bacterium]